MLEQIAGPLRGVLQPAQRREFNPTTTQYVIGGALVGAAVLGTIYLLRDDTPAPSSVRPGLEGAGGMPSMCGDLGPSYPGFAFDGVDCVPSTNTPPGIYIIDDCADFYFVVGDDGPQPDDLEARIANGVAASQFQLQGAAGADPTNIVTSFFKAWWPQCTWPPAPDDAPRIVQLYMALSILVGRKIVLQGGHVLGTSTVDAADEAVGERFVDLGYETFDPDLVPEIELPDPDDAYLDPDILGGTGMIDVGGGGIDVDEDYESPQGGIQIPPGGGGPFQPQPGDAGGWDEIDEIDVPGSIEYSQQHVLQDKDVAVPLALGYGSEALPQGTYYVRLDFVASLRAMQFINSNFSGVMTKVGQRETRNYRIDVADNDATLARIGPVFHDTANMAAPQMQQFGCAIPSSCGKLIGADYLSFFNPELRWNAGTHALELTYRNHNLVDAACQPANCPNDLDVEATITFSNDAP